LREAFDGDCPDHIPGKRIGRFMACGTFCAYRGWLGVGTDEWRSQAADSISDIRGVDRESLQDLQ
jgi:hypothetical protein